MKKYKKIGIIGGAGPSASALLYQQIIQYCQREFKAIEDNDFPEIILINYPFSPMLENQEDPKIVKELQECFDNLKKLNVTMVGIACNTLHLYLSKVNTQNITVCSTTKIVEQEKKKYRKILFFGSSTSSYQKLYQDSIGTMEYPNNEDQEILNDIIYNVLAGNIEKKISDQLSQLIEKYPSVNSVLLGCTEFSVLVNKYPISSDKIIIDILPLLAEALVKTSLK